MSPAIEKILAEINTLTPVEQEKIRKLLGQSQPSSPRSLVQLDSEIKGKYSFVETSSDAFAGRKQGEINLEEQQNGKRP